MLSHLRLLVRIVSCWTQIKLSEPNLAQIVGTDVRGTWTMVYDEGFEVTINGQVVRRIAEFFS